jgi:hypothetical protein
MTSFSGTTPTDVVELQKLLASDRESFDNFGFSVALSSDGTTAVVGAVYKDPFLYTDNGAAYVFTRVLDTWVAQQTLLPSILETESYFGNSVAISSDGNTVLVGTPYSGGTGAVYAFIRNSGVWTQQQIIVADFPDYNDEFGVSVALSSDGNTALIGASGRSTPPYAGDGAVYVFTRTGGTWTKEGPTILAGSPGSRGNSFFFGDSVSLSSDGNTAIVGARQEDVSGSARGAAYILTRSGSTWTRTQRLVASNPAPVDTDLFGWSVAISGDGLTAIVGAVLKDSPGNNDNGTAHVFILSASTWTQQGAALVASDRADNDNFGNSVALSADGNTALIGAYSEDTSPAFNNGAVYMFTRSGSTWTQQQKLVVSDRADSESFGSSVAISSDASTALVGNPGNSVSPYVGSGAAHIYALGRTLDNKLYSYDSTLGVWDVLAFGELLAPTTTIFTSSEVFVIPTGAKAVEVTCIGGGGGGGGGARFATGDAGGSGGGGGGLSKYLFRPEDIGGIDAAITVTVGAGGNAGGATASGITAAAGNNGTSGGTTSFGTYLYAYGGANGLGGTSSSSRPGGAGGVGMFAGNAGGNTSTSATATAAGAGGGGGGGATFGTGSVPTAFNLTQQLSPGNAGTSNATLRGPGSGGNGRNSNVTTVAIAGNGGLYGGGGGGGGEGSTTGSTGAGGAAGAGAGGACIIRVWYG